MSKNKPILPRLPLITSDRIEIIPQFATPDSKLLIFCEFFRLLFQQTLVNSNL